MLTPSMIVDDFDVPRAVISPAKANSPLIVDSDAMLPTPITADLLQPIAGRHAQVTQILRAVEHLQLSFRYPGCHGSLLNGPIIERNGGGLQGILTRRFGKKATLRASRRV